VSCKQTSKAALAKTKPVRPPTVNNKIKAIANNEAGAIIIVPSHKVATQLKTFIPVGIAIIIVAALKKARESTSIPTVYIWCAQTIKPKIPIEIIADIIPIGPKILLFE
jgi:hypothetical protein